MKVNGPFWTENLKGRGHSDSFRMDVWESFRMDVWEIGWEVVGWLYLTVDRDSGELL
jgi:hypothetical protein